MTPNIINLVNFHGIKAGTGLNEITIDIDAIAGDGQLILLKGDNGSGKTTVLDNLHPYRIMPSKAGGYSPRSFSYYDQTYGDAAKRLTWTHDGKQYHSELVIKGSGKTKKTEAYLRQHDSTDGWIPYRLPDGMTSDGKTITYDLCVENILGTPEMFFTAAFSSQGRKQLSAYSNADIKSIMAELLNLGDITALGEKSAEVVKLLNARVNGIRQEMTHYQGKIDLKESMRRDLDEVAISQQANDIEHSEAMDLLNVAATQLQETTRLSADTAAAMKKRIELVELHNQIGEQMKKRVDEINADVIEENKRMTSIQVRYSATIDDISQRITAAATKVKDNEALLLRREEIELACSRIDELQAELIKQEEAGRDARARHEFLKKINTTLNEANDRRRDTYNNLEIENSTLHTLIKASTLINDVPCVGTDMQPRCMLLKDANDARALIPVKEIDIERKGLELQGIDEEIKTISAQVELHKDAETQMMSAIEKYREVSAELGNVKAVAALKASIELAQTERDAGAVELESLRSGMKETEAEREKLMLEIKAIITNKQERITTVETGSKQERAALQDQIDKIPAGDESALEKAQKDHISKRAMFDLLTDKSTSLKAAAAALTERIAVLDKELAGEGKLKQELELLDTEIGNWTLLTKALGRDGIVALCIDDAGPTLSSLTNDLLLSCYGPRFTVSIETQSENAKGVAKEDFDIRVFDGDRDEDKSVSQMSGGERIYINEAMTRAIALYQAQQSGQQYGTLFSDESDGALDPGRKVMFTSMKRKVLELGGYQREIFITHTPELWDLADSVIDMDGFSS